MILMKSMAVLIQEWEFINKMSDNANQVHYNLDLLVNVVDNRVIKSGELQILYMCV